MKRVLFIGNSHTYFNDMPFLFQFFTRTEMAEKAGIEPALTTMIVHGGRMLSEHIREEEVRYNIKFGGYDYVVLQQAAHPFPGEEVLLRDGKTLSDWIHAAGAQMVAYMTWAEKRAPEHQAIMTESYTKLAEQNHGILAPVGAIWEKILQDKNAPVNLFFTDGEHASLCGSYLAAMVLFSAVYHISPVGLPCKFTYQGETIYEVEEKQAQYLQQAVNQYLFA